MDQAIQELLDKAQRLFGDIPRPEFFTHHTHCCECADHNDTLSAHTPQDIGLNELGNIAWDPICFATEEAFLYYFPALARLTLKGSGDSDYFDQLLSHVILDGARNRLGRVSVLSSEHMSPSCSNTCLRTGSRR